MDTMDTMDAVDILADEWGARGQRLESSRPGWTALIPPSKKRFVFLCATLYL